MTISAHEPIKRWDVEFLGTVAAVHVPPTAPLGIHDAIDALKTPFASLRLVPPTCLCLRSRESPSANPGASIDSVPGLLEHCAVALVPRLPLHILPPTVDRALTRFWTDLSICAASVTCHNRHAYGLLEHRCLPLGFGGFDAHRLPRFFVRNIFPRLYQRVWDSIATCNRRFSILSAAPGAGASCFAIYAMMRLLKTNPDATVLYVVAAENRPTETLVLHRSGCFSAPLVSASEVRAFDIDLCVVDCGDAAVPASTFVPPTHAPALVLHNCKAYAETALISDGTPYALVPAWTESELHRALASNKAARERALRRLPLYGGNLRLLASHATDAEVSDAFHSMLCRNNECVAVAANGPTNQQNARNKLAMEWRVLFHTDAVGDPVFCSDWAAVQFVRTHAPSVVDKWSNVLESSRVPHSARKDPDTSLYRMLFEARIAALLSTPAACKIAQAPLSPPSSAFTKDAKITKAMGPIQKLLQTTTKSTLTTATATTTDTANDGNCTAEITLQAVTLYHPGGEVEQVKVGNTRTVFPLSLCLLDRWNNTPSISSIPTPSGPALTSSRVFSEHHIAVTLSTAPAVQTVLLVPCFGDLPSRVPENLQRALLDARAGPPLIYQAGKTEAGAVAQRQPRSTGPGSECETNEWNGPGVFGSEHVGLPAVAFFVPWSTFHSAAAFVSPLKPALNINPEDWLSFSSMPQYLVTHRDATSLRTLVELGDLSRLSARV